MNEQQKIQNIERLCNELDRLINLRAWQSEANKNIETWDLLEKEARERLENFKLLLTELFIL